MSVDGKAEVLIAGGGVAGVEALLATSDMAGDRASITIFDPEPEFVYRPLVVNEPSGGDPAERHDLAGLAAEVGAGFELAGLESVDPEARSVTLTSGEQRDYDELIVCVGGEFEPAFDGVVTFPSSKSLQIGELLDRAESEGEGTVIFLVPSGVAWVLPIYELALMTAGRARAVGRDVAVRLVSPEAGPLTVFGPGPSEAVGKMLSATGVEFSGSLRAEQRNGKIVLHPGGDELGAGLIVALPDMRGRAIAGLPSDDGGFIPIDQHARVVGVDHVHAAGDGTNFPIKQGGLATQQADAAAQDIAHALGARDEPEAFQPVLRGKLFNAAESLNISAEVSGGAGDGRASHDPIWWPPDKISGRYLAAWLHRSEPGDPEVPPHGIDVEVAVPKEWHREPMAIDPLDRIG